MMPSDLIKKNGDDNNPVKEKEDLSQNPEVILVSHWIINAINPGQINESILGIIHLDLFHTDETVYQSAVKLIQKFKKQESLKYLIIIIKEHIKARKLTALKALKEMMNSSITNQLLEIFEQNQDEEIKAKILEVLIPVAQKNKVIKEKLIYFADNEIPNSPLRDVAILSLAQIDEWSKLSDLARNSENLAERLLTIKALGIGKKSQAQKILQIFIAKYKSLSDSMKLSLIESLVQIKDDQAIELINNNIPEANEYFILQILEMINHYEFFQMFKNKVTRIFLRFPSISDEVEEIICDTFDSFYKKVEDPRSKNEVDTYIEKYLYSHLLKVKKKYRGRTESLTDFEKKLNSAKEFLERYGKSEFLQKIQEYLKNPNFLITDPLYLQLENSIRVLSKSIHKDHKYDLFELEELLTFDGARERYRIAKYFQQNIDLNKPEDFRKLSRFLLFISLSPNKKCADIAYDIYKWSLELYDHRLRKTALMAMAKSGNRNLLKECELILEKEDDTSLLISAIYATGECKQEAGTEILANYINSLHVEKASDEVLQAILSSFVNINRQNNHNVIMALQKIFLQSGRSSIIYQSALALAKLATPKILDSMEEIKKSSEEQIREGLLQIAGHMQQKHKDEASVKYFQNFNYSMLNDCSIKVQIQAILNLYRLGDSSPLTVLYEIINRAQPKQKAEILKNTLEVDTITKIQMCFELMASQKEEVRKMAAMSLAFLIENRSRDANEIIKRIYDFRKGNIAKNRLDTVISTNITFGAEVIDERQKFWFEKENTKYLAIMFVDIVGYTKKSSKMELYEVMSYLRIYEEMVTQVSAQHFGTIIKKMGDGLMIAYPNSLTAVLAGIRIQERLKDYNSFKEEKDKIIVRVGINSGDIAVRENDLFGDVVNMASRMESSATPGKILVSEATYREISEFIQCKAMEPIPIKGKDKLIQTFEIVAITAALTDEMDPTLNPNLVINTHTKIDKVDYPAEQEVEIPPEMASIAAEMDSNQMNTIKKGFQIIYQEVGKIQSIHPEEKKRILQLINSEWKKIKTHLTAYTLNKIN